MNPIDWVSHRLRAIVARRALERDMQDEMALHLERATHRLIDRGLSADAARRMARREFGNVGVLQEEARDIREGRWWPAGSRIDTWAGRVRTNTNFLLASSHYV